MKPYLVKLRLYLGAYEKVALHLVQAKDAHDAGVKALKDECHDTPDFSDYPEEDACWDCGEFVYMVQGVKQLNDKQVETFKELWDFF